MVRHLPGYALGAFVIVAALLSVLDWSTLHTLVPAQGHH